MFSLNSHHHLWLFRCIFYRLLFLCTRSTFTDSFLRFTFDTCSFLLYQSVIIDQSMQYNLKCVFFFHEFYKFFIPHTVEWFSCSVIYVLIFSGDLGVPCCRKEDKAPPPCICISYRSSHLEQVPDFPLYENQKSGMARLGRVRERRGLGGIIVRLSKGWNTNLEAFSYSTALQDTEMKAFETGA